MNFDDDLHLLGERHDFCSFVRLEEMTSASFSLLHSRVWHF
jgi:hypothetical protein